jgi:superfamily II DNA or RNA helicase
MQKQDVRFRLVGLSATPVPTSWDAADDVKRNMFPLPDPTQDTNELGLHTVMFVKRQKLLEDRILCRPNDYYQVKEAPAKSSEASRDFDIRGLVKLDRAFVPRGRTPKEKLVELAKFYNREVMSNDRIIDFLARGYARHFEELGKTLIFAPTVAAANKWVDRINYHLAAIHGDRARGRVSLIHSRINEFQDLDREETGDSWGPTTSEVNVQRIIAEFRARKGEPCALVNVNMATTGFDDPQIKTLILGRLTFSTNLFWQMIGRGTRGIACGGTEFCNVIDPVYLGQAYGFSEFAEYRPTLDDPGFRKHEKDIAEAVDDPGLPPVTIDPRPATVQAEDFEKAEEVRALGERVSRILHDFLAGKQIAKEDLQELHAQKQEIVAEATTIRYRTLREQAEAALGGVSLAFIRVPTGTTEAERKLYEVELQKCVSHRVTDVSEWRALHLHFLAHQPVPDDDCIYCRGRAAQPVA